MPWWAWIIAAFLLLLLELATPGGFYFLFFGIGAGTVGLADLLGLPGPPWMEWLLFSAVSVVSMLLFRQRLLERFTKRGAEVPSDVDQLLGGTAVAVETILPGSEGKVDMRGSNWSASNLGPETIAAGQRCRVDKVDGLVLGVRAEPVPAVKV